MSEQGVHYAGSERQPMSAARAAATGERVAGISDLGPGDHWPRLLEEIEQCGAERVVVSSEFFADADDQAARRVVEDLGGSSVHVVVTLRPLARILPSQWQQFVQARLVTPYEEWLHQMLDGAPPADPPPGFWRRHRHDLLVRRWAEAVGTENLTVVMAEGPDRDRPLHVFENLVGLRRGTLVPDPEDSNRSLSADEVALVRALNSEVARHDEIDLAAYNRLVRFGMCRLLVKEPMSADRPRLTTPRWAVERAQEIGSQAAESIHESGVRVIGDVALLAAGTDAVGDVEEPTTLDIQTAARATTGAVLSATRQARREAATRARRTARAKAPATGPRLTEATMRQIVGEVRRRLLRR
ncbi:hypothetical protein [Solicola sp. PLA-1-18]|uniref:hypothetical protein n=1 Tax=Solicola sp. PLA-1-18 TaxID=3380532 RepID=UPI003B7FB6E2